MLSGKITSRRQYEDVTPSILIPDHFVCNQETRMVVLYDIPIGEEHEKITIQFPGDVVGSSTRQIATRRVGSQSVVFNTPVYSTSRGQVEVTPILETQNGYKIQMGKFRLTLKHPLTTAMELSMKLSTSSAVLPILTTLMLNASGDKEDQFKDPHTDRMMTLLVGSMKPGSSCAIKDVLLPDKNWKKKHLTDLAQKFGLRNMEKEAYMLNAPRKRTFAKRSETMVKQNEMVSVLESSPDLLGEREAVISSSFSSPTINTAGLDIDDVSMGPFEVDRVSMWNQLKNNTKQAYVVIQDFYSQEPGKISLKVGQKVYVVTFHSSEAGWWYGACEGRHGLFPASCVESIYDPQKSSARLLPLPPLPRKPQTEVEKRLSLPFKQPLIPTKTQHAMGLRPPQLGISSKAYRKASDADVSSSSSRSSSRRGSQDLLTEGNSSESGEYVDMVTREKKYSTYTESDNESLTSSASVEDKPVPFTQQRPWAQKFQDSSPQSPGKKRPIFTPPEKISKATPGQAQYSPQSSQPSRAGPVPPTRTVSMSRPIHDELPKSETYQSDNEDSSDDDMPYVNLGEEGLPLTRFELEKKYENFDFDIVHGHMYDRPADISSPVPLTKASQYPNTDTTWQPDGKELEARRYARHMARITHENVVLAKVKKPIKTPPLPPPKPTARGATPGSEQVNWLNQELQAKSQGWRK